MRKDITIGEKYKPAINITRQEDADVYFEELVQHNMLFGYTREQAEDNERNNLGYFAGYYGNDTRERVEELFKCKHPVFGSIKENGAPSPWAAFSAGLNYKKLGK